jgi:hypothetical protein
MHRGNEIDNFRRHQAERNKTSLDVILDFPRPTKRLRT